MTITFTIYDEVKRHMDYIVHRAITESVTLQQMIDLLRTACGDDATGGEAWLVERETVEELADEYVVNVQPTNMVSLITEYSIRAMVDTYARSAITVRVKKRIEEIIHQVEHQLWNLEDGIRPGVDLSLIIIAPHRGDDDIWVGEDRIGISWPCDSYWTMQELPIKTAHVLSTVQMETDPYHTDIVRGAIEIADQGRGSWVYVTHYESGSTCWRNPATGETALINTIGRHP